jgi:hypothetical protein
MLKKKVHIWLSGKHAEEDYPARLFGTLPRATARFPSATRM